MTYSPNSVGYDVSYNDPAYIEINANTETSAVSVKIYADENGRYTSSWDDINRYILDAIQNNITLKKGEAISSLRCCAKVSE